MGASLPGTRDAPWADAVALRPRWPGLGGMTDRARGSRGGFGRMTRSPNWSPRIAVLVTTAALLFAACGGSTATTPPSAAPASEAPASAAPASAEAFTPMVYPVSGEAPCGQAAAPDATHDKYAGELKKISATAAKTVVFELRS